MTRILTRPELWGPDFPRLLAHLQALQRSGHARVIVFADRVVLTTAFSSRVAADSAAERLTAAVNNLRANPTPLYTQQIGRGPANQAPPRVEVIPSFPEDRSIRVAITSLQLLRPGLRTATVRELLGRPDRSTQQLIEGPGEERPLILTILEYAGGAIRFAEADIAPRPGLVNRVDLDVGAAIAALQ